MQNIFFIHWNEKELKEMIAPLKKAGYRVGYHFSQEKTADLKENLPDIMVICLDRLPSHGRAYAEWLWEAKKRQQIPIVFCGGKDDKIKTTRERFPSAVFCATENLLDTLSAIR